MNNLTSYYQWMILTYEGHLKEPNIYNNSFETEEEAEDAYCMNMTTWPDKMVLIKKYAIE